MFDPKYKGKIGLMDYALDMINMGGLVLYGKEDDEGGVSGCPMASSRRLRRS